jgi:hypothetical protein
MVLNGDLAACIAAALVDQTMSRVIAVALCGFSLAACSSSLPSFDIFRGGPASEQLRIESEPPGADAKTSQGQTCRTPCELTVAAEGEIAITVAMNGFQPQTVPVRSQGGSDGPRLQPNPVYVELEPAAPSRPAKKAPAKKKKVTAKAAPKTSPAGEAPAPASNASPYPTGYPWPAPQ